MVLVIRTGKHEAFFFVAFDKDGKQCGLSFFMTKEALGEFIFLIEMQGGKQISMIDVMTDQYERWFLGSDLLEAWDWRHETDGLRIIIHGGRAEYAWKGQEVITPWKGIPG